MTIRKDFICWVDLETTGSSDESEIIEIGSVITTSTDFRIVDEFSKVVECSPEGVESILTNPVVLDMHTKHGLLYDLMTGPTVTIGEADIEFVDWLNDSVGKKSDHLPLGGSGVSHFDRKFIRRDLPLANKRLTYWAYDVGVMRRLFALAGLKWLAEEDQKTHRALDDIKLHVEEMKFGMNLLRRSHALQGDVLKLLGQEALAV